MGICTTRCKPDDIIDLLFTARSHAAGNNISFNDLSPLSAYVGKIGDSNRGGSDFDGYMARQNAHRDAEIRAMYDIDNFIHKAQDIYGYPHFLNDTGGSMCELNDPDRTLGQFPNAKMYQGDRHINDVTIWCSNDYLGMGQNQSVIDAMHQAIDECGAGAGGTRNISGTNFYHAELEKEIASLHQKESALIFNSGYMSNWTSLSTLGSKIPDCLIISDAGNHASMIEGIRHSKVDKEIFKHNDVADLERILKKYPKDRPKIIAFESVYSMEGSKIPDCLIISDAGNHASMIEGIRHSKVDKEIFKHNDVADLERILKKYPKDRPKIIAFESVYSMEGDISPVDEICALAKEYQALTYIDEVHAVGMYGQHGGGVSERLQVADQLDIIEGTLGKAYGVIGGYIAGDHHMIDFIRSFASGFIFTTALPPAVAAGAIASIRHLKNSQVERDQQRENVAKVRDMLESTGIPFLDTEGHIIPVMVNDAVICKAISDELLHDYCLYIQPINYPTVAKGTERLRITPTPLHNDNDIAALGSALDALWKKYKLPRHYQAIQAIK
eukprot:maker-scaffold218_size252335-snap-gene-1.3 protein:Tk09649 transcript:maker-scaffold218_size252335-snap-gene-1.3-mRNA-1 annotation:"5-aminolevulinate synthase"